MRNPEVICNDGFKYFGNFRKDESISYTILALYSLRTAMKAYVSTYKMIWPVFHLFHRPDNTTTQDQIDRNHTPSYIEACTETLLHLQHFIELFIKDILRNENELLAIDASENPVIFHKLLNKEDMNEEEYNKINTVEFSKALTRLCELIKADRLSNKAVYFIKGEADWLIKLNSLRNSIWHRGIKVIRYNALDELICGYALPFIKKVMSLNHYHDHQDIWLPEEIECGIKPFDELEREYKNHTPDVKKLAFLKELCRAAYENPVPRHIWIRELDEKEKRISETAAESERIHQNAWAIKNCPVCGSKALLVHDDSEIDDYDPESSTYGHGVWFTYKAECICCSLQLRDELKNPKEYGYNIEDLWESKEV